MKMTKILTEVPPEGIPILKNLCNLFRLKKEQKMEMMMNNEQPDGALVITILASAFSGALFVGIIWMVCSLI